MLTVKDWQRIQDLFHAAVELPEADQDAYLQSACQGDAALYRQVRSLLLSVTTTGIEETVAQVAAGLEEADSPQPGHRIGPWTIVRLLGEGGMGRVYLAERADDEYKKQVAIKVVAAGLNSPAILARFRRERQILSGLEHPNIARMLEGGATAQGSPYVVMDYVEGLPIDAYCQTNQLPIRARLDLFLQVCSAVQYAHQNFVIHRDIKPGNILVDNTGTPKLLDFGIAKLLEDDLPSNALTRAAERILTPEYASPEQLEGVPVTTASDVYSLGALLFELLSTKPLHTKSRKLNAQDEAPKPSATAPRDFQKELSGDLDNIVRKSIAQDPTQRYSTAGQLADDITRYLTGFPVLAQPDRFAYRAKKFLRRHKAGVAVAAIFLVSIIGFASAMAYLARQARDEAANATAVSNFLVDIFQTASPEQARGRPATAIEILDRGSQRVRSEMASRPSVQATLLQAMGEVYLKTGEHAKAKPLLEDALKIRERESGPDSLEAASALSALASYCDARSQYPEAEKYWKRVLSIREKLLPPNDFKLGETWRDIGMNHYYIGRYPQAADSQRKALAIFRALNRGPEAESARNNLAIADFEMANYQSAAEIHRENVKRRVARLGETHPLTLTSMNNLTFPLDMLGLLRESNDIAFRVLGIRRKVMGEMHPDTARSWSTYGFGRRALGDQAQFIEALRKAIEIRVARLDPNDVELATARFSLAEALIEEGQNAEAKQLVDQAMASLLSRKIPGRLSVAKRAYGKVYYMLGQREVGEKFLNEAIDSWRNLTGRRKLGKAEGLQTRGELFLAEGRTKEAERDFAEALALRSSVYPEQHPTVAFTRACLAQAQSRNGQDAQGRELLTKSLQTMEQALLPTHPDIYILRAWLSPTPLPAALRSNRRVNSLTSAKTQYRFVDKPVRNFSFLIRIFSQPDNQSAELRLRILRLLTHALELNLLEGRGLPTQNLKDSLTRLCATLEKDLPEPNVLLQAGDTSTSIQQYFLQLTRSLDALATDLSHGIRVLEEAIAASDGEHSNHLSRLEAATRNLSKTRGLDDLHLLQKQFEDSLAAFRQSQSRHHGTMTRAIESLRETSQQVPGAPPKLIFAVFHLRRLDLMRDRFGAALVQELLDYFTQLLASRWTTLEDLKPFNTDSLIAFDTKDLALERHRHAMCRLSSERIVYTTTHQDREYILPIAFDWLVNHAESKPHAESQAQAFLAQQSQKEREILHLDQILKS